MDFYRGYCVQFASSISIMIGSYYGLPLSSTHCNIGAIYGVVVATLFPWYNEVYSGSSHNEEKEVKHFVVLKIILWWLVTVPVSFSTTFLLTKVILAI
mmetsp:Transcript_10873/g.11004  ORF Transcript_10873/g.11004 Transcript_10873/m.11004 type:complete len:98 (+) Transcript_10873:490-783(+)